MLDRTKLINNAILASGLSSTAFKLYVYLINNAEEITENILDKEVTLLTTPLKNKTKLALILGMHRNILYTNLKNLATEGYIYFANRKVVLNTATAELRMPKTPNSACHSSRPGTKRCTKNSALLLI